MFLATKNRPETNRYKKTWDIIKEVIANTRRNIGTTGEQQQHCFWGGGVGLGCEKIKKQKNTLKFQYILSGIVEV